MVQNRGSVSFFFMWQTSYVYTIYWTVYSFPIVYSWLFCHKLIDHMCMGLLLGLFYSIDMCLFLCQYYTILTNIAL